MDEGRGGTYIGGAGWRMLGWGRLFDGGRCGLCLCEISGCVELEGWILTVFSSMAVRRLGVLSR